MNGKVRVLHILSSNRFSGAENVVCQIIHMFRNDLEYEFVYCSPDGEIRLALKERNIKFKSIKKMSISEIKRVIEEINPDIIHAHDMRASFFAALACKKIPLITHIHNNSYESRKPTVKSILYWFAGKKSKHIFWVSKSAYEGYCFHRGIQSKSSILYNVIDAEQLIQKANSAANKEKYDVIYLGRLTYPKNPERVVEVLEKVKMKYPKLSAAIIGTGELENEIKEIINLKGMNDNICMCGFMNNPYGILQNAKVMLMTSRWEGTPMCALEAMALGIPIVSTPTDGLKEIVDCGKTGYLSDQNNVLEEKIYELITNENILSSFRKKCLEKNRMINNSFVYKDRIRKEYDLCIEVCNK